MLINKEGSSGNTWISLGSGNRTDFSSGLGVDGDGNRRDPVDEGGIEGQSTGERWLELGGLWRTL